MKNEEKKRKEKQHKERHKSKIEREKKEVQRGREGNQSDFASISLLHDRECIETNTYDSIKKLM